MVYAHRGGAALAPENTLVAFETGLATGADGIELDVRLSADGVAVVVHDASLDRTTNAIGLVAERTAAQLAVLDAGFRFERDGAYPFRGRGIAVPTLGDVLDRHQATPMIIELKSPDSRLARAVVDAIDARGAADHVTVGSFQQGALEAVRAMAPLIRTGADTDDVRNGVNTLRARPVFDEFQVPELFAGMRVVTPEFIAQAHDAGVTVLVWTVNHPDDMRRLLEWGVDGLITDRPDIAVPLVRDWYGRRLNQ